MIGNYFKGAIAASALLLTVGATTACQPEIPVPTFPPTTHMPLPSDTPVPPMPTTKPVSSTKPPTTTKVSSTTRPPIITLTTPPRPTTTIKPTTALPTTPPPVLPGDSAAVKYGWGTPIPEASDEFLGSTLDKTKWGAYDGTGHDGNGRRVGSLNTVEDGFLRQIGLSNGDTAGLASTYGQRYGRVEVRARATAAQGATGSPYHPVLILWPDSDRWPQGGELDFMETDIGDQEVGAFIHYPADTVIQDHFSHKLDLSQWHNYAIEWTPEHIRGYIDGVQWFDVTNKAAQPPGPMHLTIQLDNFYGSGMQAATFDVDWVHTYRP